MLRAVCRPALVGRRAFSAAAALPRACVTNLKTLNYDSNIDMTRLGEVASVESYDYSTTDEIIQRSQGFDILITKEVPVTAETIGKLGAEVKLICEAGTGFNNIDLAAASARGITVTNVADYSSDSVAHLALTFILNFSCSMIPQQRMSWEGDRKVFSQDVRMLHHVEVNNKTLGLIGGAGTIGTKLARVAVAMGMRVIDSSVDPPREAREISIATLRCCVHRVSSQSLTLPATPAGLPRRRRRVRLQPRPRARRV